MRLAAAALAAVIAFACPVAAKDEALPAALKEGEPNPIVALVRGAETFCTGAYIGNGRFLTAGHCVDDASSEFRLKTDNVNGGDYSFRVLHYIFSSPKRWNGMDFAILYGDPAVTATLPALSLNCSAALSLGQPIAVEGFPEDMGRLRVSGQIASYSATPFTKAWPQKVWRVQIPITYGDSGAPVMDTAGKVIGILVGGAPSNRTLAFMQPLGPICEALGMR